MVAVSMPSGSGISSADIVGIPRREAGSVDAGSVGAGGGEARTSRDTTAGMVKAIVSICDAKKGAGAIR